MRNRWGIEIKKGYFVQGRGPRGGDFSGVVAAVDSTSAYAKAYGALLLLDSGKSVSADDVSQTLGPMRVGRNGIVKQNPLTRIKKSQIKTKPSQLTGLPPDARLIKRRKRTAATPIPGIYANPLSRVKSRTSESQRSHVGPNGKRTKHATRRLIKRRDYTDVVPAGFYANPLPPHYGSSTTAEWVEVLVKKTTDKRFKIHATFEHPEEAKMFARALHNKHPAWSIKVQDAS